MVSSERLTYYLYTSFSAPALSNQRIAKAPSVRIKRKCKIDGNWTFATIARKGDRTF
ncbi:MAG TPA: hypothetical protein VK638_49045 [Edaphobacter sp.]|nr:hypothetical protein [Edaphobacter sp.]